MVPYNKKTTGTKLNSIHMEEIFMENHAFYLTDRLGQFTRNYTQTTKRGLLTTNKG